MSERSSQESELLQPQVRGDQEALDAVAPVIYQGLTRLAPHHLKSVRATHHAKHGALDLVGDGRAGMGMSRAASP